MTVTLVCWRDQDWYVGRAKEIPGVFSQGKSLVALQKNLADAIQLMAHPNKCATVVLT
jgi:predicted RNase H-like HicB family nuclease